MKPQNKFNSALCMLGLAITATREGEHRTAAAALARASRLKSSADIMETVHAMLKEAERVKAAKATAGRSKTVADLARAIAEAQDSDLIGEEHRVEVDDKVTSEAEDEVELEDDDSEEEDSDDDGEEEKASATARMKRALANLNLAGKL
jgi:hypothetical protein